MSPWTILGAVVLVGLLTGAAYRQGREDGEAKIVAQQAREDALAAKASAAAADAAASAISAIKVQHRTITQEVQHEVSERVVYRDCQHSPEQLQRINAALTGAARPVTAGSGIVPGTDAPQ